MDSLLPRINELSRKSREVGLTEEEKAEQQELRQRYLANFRSNMKAQLDNVYIVDENGNEKKLGSKNN